MNRFCFVGLLLLTVICGFGQDGNKGTITGKVIDSATKAPLEYATVSIYLADPTKPINGAATDKNGVFTITDVADSTYTVVCEFIGYSPIRIPNVTASHSTINLKTILLAAQPKTLQGITVTAKGRLIENKIDKMVFNAEKDVTSQSGVATDVLKKVPQVSVDADGNVQLAGSGGVRFLINGKPSTAFGSSISDVLQSIPASQIKSIEVITNPGAKYDAAGMGGIINIILKSSNAKGYNGSLALTVGTLQENGSLNLNVRNGNFGMNAFVSGNARLKSTVYSTSDRIATTDNRQTILHQEGQGQFTRSGYQTGLGFDWTPQKHNSFSGSFSFNHFGSKGTGSSLQDQQYYTGSTLGDILSRIQSRNDFQFHNVDAGLSYKRTFAKEDRELEINVNSSFGNDHSGGSNSQFLLPQDSLYYGTTSQNPGKTRETEVKVDYTEPLQKDVTLGIGSKLSLYDINSNSQVLRYMPSEKAYAFNSSLSNGLDYHQYVYALYSEISFPVGKILNAKIGGRYERTEINSYYSNTLHQIKVPGYNTFVPSVYLSKNIDEKQSLKLSYSRRIERPDYHDLNPFVNTNDPKNLTAGNPSLQPEIGNRIELGYSKEMENLGSFMVSLFYRMNDHDIQPYLTYYPSYQVGDSVYTNVTINRRQNIGMEKNVGVSLFADIHVSDKFTVRSNAFLFHRHTINILDPGFNSFSFNYRFNINTAYQFTPTFSGEFFGNFNSSRREAQGFYPSFTFYTIALRKQFWNKKGSLAFTTTNPFSEYINQETRLFSSNFTTTSIRKIPFRSFGLSFAWKFGKLEFKPKREEGGNNMNVPVEQ
ncbi:TonB-dependent receptor domain-containing protein [Flavisolibacter nicotianae]|uniref:TonB-dependent receptor domain-containing protein n=1 Tax=Flavisolibacter nicotianae TaxID=2364882 RepID=UPI000EB397EE|nr:TonB-dependent receptor [Flavisolibacter nicotianae]